MQSKICTKPVFTGAGHVNYLGSKLQSNFNTNSQIDKIIVDFAEKNINKKSLLTPEKTNELLQWFTPWLRFNNNVNATYKQSAKNKIIILKGIDDVGNGVKSMSVNISLSKEGWII